MNDKTKQALELASEELQFFHIAGLARLQTLEAITAIKEAIALETVLLAEQPTQQDIPDLIAGALGVSRGTAYDLMREALVGVQPQEPVAYMNPQDMEKMKRFGRGSVAWATPTDFCTQPVYTSPPPRKPWVGLADEDKQIAFDDTQEGGGFWEFADAIEAKLREKNA